VDGKQIQQNARKIMQFDIIAIVRRKQSNFLTIPELSSERQKVKTLLVTTSLHFTLIFHRFSAFFCNFALFSQNRRNSKPN
jgi:hypothetical protein